MIDVKEAAEKAGQYLGDLSESGVYDVNLEEVELSEDEAFWHIALGFPRDPVEIMFAELGGVFENMNLPKAKTC